tara:strand:- start:902 stop:2683 length:1782 start_codon:yes stop_codon:yes gene_type:complete
MNNIIKKTILLAVSSLLIGITIGVVFIKILTNESHDSSTSSEKINEIWTCSMHPQIRKSEAGSCPLCGMDLILLNSMGSLDANPMEITMSPTAMQLANVQTAIVEKKLPIKEIRLNGKVQVDESTLSSQTSHISGRIEKLLINSTGASVSKGQILAYIYSPELITAQQELFEAQEMKETNPQLFEAVKQKLTNWKLTNKQINTILASGKPFESFPILADRTGIVIKKRVNVGDHINNGSSLYEVADLSKVWILFDIYEIDLGWVKIGDEINYTIQSLPSSKFKGKVTFIDPVINPKTRVAKARVVVNNTIDLKPETFVTGNLSSQITDNEKVIVIPKTAVMWTGEKSVVYIKTSDIGGVSFIMRKVILGPSLGSTYIIKDGLEVGEEIATNGTFSIDASAQLAGKPSMMNPEGAVLMTGHSHKGEVNKPNTPIQIDTVQSSPISVNKEVKESLIPLYNLYIELKNTLVNDDFTNAIRTAKKFETVFNKINGSIFKGEAHNIWMKHSSIAKKSINELINSTGIESSRKHFISLSTQMIILAKKFNPTQKTLYIQHCPMADQDKGADWISIDEEIENPYFGTTMLKCGEVQTTIK